MKLYDMPGNTNSRKIRAVAKELDLRLEIVALDLKNGEHKTPEFLQINPNGKIPAFVDGELTLFESNAILCYVAAKSGATKLLPVDAAGRAKVDQWLFWQSAHLSPAIGKVVFERVYKPHLGLGALDQTKVEEGLVEIERFCGVLDGALADRNFICGDLTVADFSLAATFGHREAAQIDVSKFKNITQWLSAVEARPSWVHSAVD